jgi:hypothetical protein
MIRFIALALLALLCLTGAGPDAPAQAQDQVAQAPAPERICRIGRPAYCFKYGGLVCSKRTDIGPKRRERNCGLWTDACLDCHREIPGCLGVPRMPASNPQCSVCHDAWLACMKRIDRKFWPARNKNK